MALPTPTALPIKATPAMPPDGPTPAKGPARFRTTLIRVLVVQAVALTLLGLLQAVYNVSPTG